MTKMIEGAEIPELDSGAKQEFLKSLTGVALSSDAFFPFRDSIDVVSCCCRQYELRWSLCFRPFSSSKTSTSPVDCNVQYFTNSA